MYIVNWKHGFQCRHIVDSWQTQTDGALSPTRLQYSSYYHAGGLPVRQVLLWCVDTNIKIIVKMWHIPVLKCYFIFLRGQSLSMGRDLLFLGTASEILSKSLWRPTVTRQSLVPITPFNCRKEWISMPQEHVGNSKETAKQTRPAWTALCPKLPPNLGFLALHAWILSS